MTTNGSGGRALVRGEARVRARGQVATFPVSVSADAAENQHFRVAEAQVLRGAGKHSFGKIEMIEYIVNPTLEVAYDRKKKELAVVRGAEGVNEKTLYHGTSFSNSDAIIKENFRLDKVGSTTDKGWYGHGIYFSEDIEALVYYMGPDCLGTMILSKVLVGRANACPLATRAVLSEAFFT
jgi:hypothetical protein